MKASFKRNLFNIALGTTAALTSIAALNKLVFVNATKRQRLYSKKSDFFNWRYGKVYYTVRGEGAPLLLIHGIDVGSSSYEYHELVNQLANNYTVYTIDLLGFGRSDKPKLTYTAYLYVQLINDFIKSVIKRPTNIVASSLSTSFVIMACNQNKSLYEKLLLINPPSINSLTRSPGKLSNLSRKLLESPIIGTSIYNTMASKYAIRSNLKQSGFYNPRNVSRKLVKVYHEASHIGQSSNKYPIASLLTQYMNTDIRHALSSLDQSIYIISSSEATTESPSIIEQYREYNRSIEASVIPNAKLLPQFEHMEEILETCQIFF